MASRVYSAMASDRGPRRAKLGHVARGERRRDLRRHPLSHSLGLVGPDPVEVGPEQPSTDAPRHADVARQDDRGPVERAAET